MCLFSTTSSLNEPFVALQDVTGLTTATSAWRTTWSCTARKRSKCHTSASWRSPQPAANKETLFRWVNTYECRECLYLCSTTTYPATYDNSGDYTAGGGGVREWMQGYVVAGMSVVPAVIIINQGGGGGSCGVPLLVQNFSKFTRLFIIAQTNKPPTHNTKL